MNSSDRFDPVYWSATLDTFKRLEDTMSKLEQAQTKTDLQLIIESFAKQNGFKMVGQLLFQKSQDQSWSTSEVNYAGDELNTEYIRQNIHVIDPCIKRALFENHPIPWGLAHHRENPTKLEKKLWQFHEEMGNKQGVVCPVHGPGYTSFLGVTDTGSERDFMLRLPQLAPLIHMFSVMLTSAMARISAEAMPASLKTHPDLSSREHDCLAWTAEGKTAWETSVILGISEPTVIFHIENAKKKLGAKTTTQAVAKALRYRVIL